MTGACAKRCAGPDLILLAARRQKRRRVVMQDVYLYRSPTRYRISPAESIRS